MTANVTERTLLNVKEAAAELDVSAVTIRRAIASGELRALRVGEHGRFRIRRADLDALLRPTTRESA